jgi:hypothetical protein
MGQVLGGLAILVAFWGGTIAAHSRTKDTGSAYAWGFIVGALAWGLFGGLLAG